MSREYESETERNIRLYRAALPRMRGRVMAVLWLLIISAALLMGTTFAWVTLSTSPEVTGVTTTVTANGALEIALSDADGLEPDASAVGDSSAAQSVTKANLTWGNLVNLSDSSYGLENIVLRPAVLNLYDLLTSPLQAVSYGSDGRVTAYTDSFAYTQYDPDDELVFTVPDEAAYGVRAISFINYENEEANAAFAALKSAAYSALAAADYDYNDVVSNEDYISALAGMMGPYVSQYAAAFLGYTAGDGDCSDYIEGVYYMALDLQSAYEELGEAYAAIAKLQQAKADANGSYDEWTVETLLAATDAELAAAGIAITDLDTYAEDRAALAGYIDELYGYYVAYRDNGTKVYYSDLSEIINFVADVSTATINGMTIDDSALMGYVIKNYNDLAVSIKSGFLCRVEQRLQSSLMAADVPLKVTAGSYSLTPKVDVSTSAEGMTAWDDYSEASTGAMFTGTNPTPRETYALAVDLWVRTNMSGSYLTLQGDVVTDEETGEIIGYVGDNRVWEDYELTSNGAATTQGTGSCYIFSAEDPLEALKMLDLLDAMSVAFVSADGTLLAYADMDTENIWQDSGRYVVPIVVRGSGSNYITVNGEDGESEEIVYYITALEKNAAQRITAILYLDGTRLTNEQASAANEIVGQLNLQFGGTEALAAVNSEELYNQTISAAVTASVDELNYTGSAQTVTLTAEIETDGAEPTSVTGYFLRQLSSTQGVRQETLTFTQTSGGVWTATAELTASGTYILNALTIDGVMYTLSGLGGENVSVAMSGYSVSKVSGEYASGASIIDAGSSTSAELTVTLYNTTLDSFDDEHDDVTSIQAVFLSEDGTVASAELTRDSYDRQSGTYSGTFTFSSGGSYTLTYVYVNGDAYMVADDLQYTLNITLGMSARVWISTDAELAEGESATYFTLPEDEGGYVTLDVSVALTDDSGSAMTAADVGSNTLTIKYKADTGYELDADLTYNSVSEYYEGKVNVLYGGVYTFRSLTYTGGTVTRISNAPSITALTYSPTVTEFYGDSTAASQVILTSKAYISVDLTNATELSVTATVTDDAAGVSYEGITGTLAETYATAEGDSVSTYTFELPTGESGATQDGTYSLASLTLTDFTDADGTEYSSAENEYSTWDMTEEDISTKVVSTIYVDLEYTGTETTFTGEFMDEHTIEGFSATLTDYEDEGIPESYVSNIDLVCGCVVSTSGALASAPSTYPAEFDEDVYWVYSKSSTTLTLYNGTYKSSPAAICDGDFAGEGCWTFTPMLRLDGTYYPNVSVTVDGRTFGISGNYITISDSDVNGAVWELTDDSVTVTVGTRATTVKTEAVTGTIYINNNSMAKLTVTSTKPTVSIVGFTPDSEEVFSIYCIDDEVDELYVAHNYLSSTTGYVYDQSSWDEEAGAAVYTHSDVILQLTGISNFDTLTVPKTTYATTEEAIAFTPEQMTVSSEVACSASATAYINVTTSTSLTIEYKGLSYSLKPSAAVKVNYYTANVGYKYIVRSVLYKLDTAYMTEDYQNQSEDFYAALDAVLPERATAWTINGTDAATTSGISSSSTYSFTVAIPENVTFTVDGTTYRVTQWAWRGITGSGYSAVGDSTNTNSSYYTILSSGASQTTKYGGFLCPYNFEVVG